MFDRFLGEVERSESVSGYPPYNIRKDEENIYTIEMAVAGFSKEDLEAELKEGILMVRSNRIRKKASICIVELPSVRSLEVLLSLMI